MKRKALGVLLSIMMLGTCVITGCGEGGSEAPAPQPEQSEPVYRMGGKLARRIKK